MTKATATIPSSIDGSVRALLERADKHLPAGLRRIGVCILHGVTHTWGGCGHAYYEEGVLPPPAAITTSIAAASIYSLEQCSACARQLREGGGTSRWLQHQLGPYTALEDWESGLAAQEETLARMIPTGLIDKEGMTALLQPFERRTPFTSGTIMLIRRESLAPEHTILLNHGHHSPDGRSIISTHRNTPPDVGLLLGRATAGPQAEDAAAVYFTLEKEWRGEPADLWETAMLLHKPPARRGGSQYSEKQQYEHVPVRTEEA